MRSKKPPARMSAKQMKALVNGFSLGILNKGTERDKLAQLLKNPKSTAGASAPQQFAILVASIADSPIEMDPKTACDVYCAAQTSYMGIMHTAFMVEMDGGKATALKCP